PSAPFSLLRVHRVIRNLRHPVICSCAFVVVHDIHPRPSPERVETEQPVTIDRAIKLGTIQLGDLVCAIAKHLADNKWPSPARSGLARATIQGWSRQAQHALPNAQRHLAHTSLCVQTQLVTVARSLGPLRRLHAHVLQVSNLQSPGGQQLLGGHPGAPVPCQPCAHLGVDRQDALVPVHQLEWREACSPADGHAVGPERRRKVLGPLADALAVADRVERVLDGLVAALDHAVRLWVVRRCKSQVDAHPLA
ncbi:hypothetical protein BC831DRAFT_524526, partial [Entophlyctis helioformis]